MKNFILILLFAAIVFPAVAQDPAHADLTATWKATPTATISGISQICSGESADLTIILTNGAPSWDIVYTDGVMNYPVTITSSPHIITVFPTTNTVYTLLSVENSECVGTVSGGAVVTVDNPPVFSVFSLESTSCFGFSDGQAQVDIVSGTSPYSYYWDNGYGSSIETHLSVGTHSVTVTDANGCTNAGSVSIAEPTELSIFNYTITNIHCGGSSNGAITVLPIGGFGDYDYNWSNGDVGSTATGLSTGAYTVTVTDANGCIFASLPYTVLMDPDVTPTFNPNDVVHVTCFDGSNGSAEVHVSGGTEPYDYEWSSGDYTAHAGGLVAGNYSVTVTDANGCSGATSTIIDQPTEVLATLTTTNVSCDGVTLGTASVTVVGGTAPYNYEWNSTSAITSSISNLDVNGYWVTVTDDNDCEATNYPVSFLIEQDVAPSVSISSSNSGTSCGGDPVDLTTDVSGGDSFIYNWSTGHTDLGITVTPTSAMMYYVSVTNNFGCTVVDSIYIDIYDLPVIVFDPDQNVCEGLTYVDLLSSVSVSFGSISDAWIDGQFVIDNILNTSLMDPGVMYEYTAYYSESGSSCMTSVTAYITLQGLPEVQFDWAGGNLCNNGTSVNLSGGTPIDGVYSGTGVVDGEFYPSVAGSGTHIITYTYENSYGCVANAIAEIVVEYPVPIEITTPYAWCTEDGVLEIGVSPSGGFMTANGSPLAGDEAPSSIFYFDPAVAGTNEVIYTLTNGCTDSETINIEVYESPDATISCPAIVSLTDTVQFEIIPNVYGGQLTIDGEATGWFHWADEFSLGEHTVVYTFDNGLCVSETSVTFMVNGTDDIQDVDITSLISIYPNPVNDILNIEMGDTKISEIQVYSMLGKLIYESRVESSSHSIDVSGFNPSMYFIRFVDEDGSVSDPIKFIKK